MKEKKVKKQVYVVESTGGEIKLHLDVAMLINRPVPPKGIIIESMNIYGRIIDAVNPKPELGVKSLAANTNVKSELTKAATKKVVAKKAVAKKAVAKKKVAKKK